MNNSASRLKIAIDSTSLFLDSASLVEEFRYSLVESRIGESRDDSVSCVREDSEVVGLGESRGDSTSRVLD